MNAHQALIREGVGDRLDRASHLTNRAEQDQEDKSEQKWVDCVVVLVGASECIKDTDRCTECQQH